VAVHDAKRFVGEATRFHFSVIPVGQNYLLVGLPLQTGHSIYGTGGRTRLPPGAQRTGVLSLFGTGRGTPPAFSFYLTRTRQRSPPHLSPTPPTAILAFRLSWPHSFAHLSWSSPRASPFSLSLTFPMLGAHAACVTVVTGADNVLPMPGATTSPTPPATCVDNPACRRRCSGRVCGNDFGCRTTAHYLPSTFGRPLFAFIRASTRRLQAPAAPRYLTPHQLGAYYSGATLAYRTRAPPCLAHTTFT